MILVTHDPIPETLDHLWFYSDFITYGFQLKVLLKDFDLLWVWRKYLNKLILWPVIS